jgi:hypothetical protein
MDATGRQKDRAHRPTKAMSPSKLIRVLVTVDVVGCPKKFRPDFFTLELAAQKVLCVYLVQREQRQPIPASLCFYYRLV